MTETVMEKAPELIVTTKKLLSIGSWLQELRGEIPQRAIAKSMKTDQPNISSLESGTNRKNPSFRIFFNYLKACGYNIIVKKDDNRIIVSQSKLKSFGSFLRSLRGDTPQEVVVGKMGVKQSYVSMLESEKSPKNPSITTLINYLKAIDCVLLVEKKHTDSE